MWVYKSVYKSLDIESPSILLIKMYKRWVFKCYHYCWIKKDWENVQEKVEFSIVVQTIVIVDLK